jgi:hypothetical protein
MPDANHGLRDVPSLINNSASIGGGDQSAGFIAFAFDPRLEASVG